MAFESRAHKWFFTCEAGPTCSNGPTTIVINVASVSDDHRLDDEPKTHVDHPAWSGLSPELRLPQVGRTTSVGEIPTEMPTM
ncbi:uncharacterized protein N7496_000086 [Penicillium cataractarum]|uniref:Uncharacterized protein n=1 Tax=Penicillium cataractarum TaxID=2100454 RepID=A0A9W9VTH2_9EURO|nr:uncharacterized protein N7496_000086 [Penicillium cataractarum]KAJ5389018.1 hypothetical protein N7496_000086 [Penicillium cataractarum]